MNAPLFDLSFPTIQQQIIFYFLYIKSMTFLYIYREKENKLNKEYGKLVEQRDYLTSDVDLHKMEISRQEHLLCRQQREITDLKLKLQNALEQMEV